MPGLYVMVGGLCIALALLTFLWFRCHDAYVGATAVNQSLQQFVDAQNAELSQLRTQLSQREFGSNESHRLMLEARTQLLQAHSRIAVFELRDKFLSECMGYKVEQFRIMLNSPITSDKEKEQLIQFADAAKAALTTTKQDDTCERAPGTS